MNAASLRSRQSVRSPALETISSSDAKNGFAELIERVARSGERILITRNKRPAAVVLSVEEYRQLVETAPDLLSPLRERFAAIVAGMQTSSGKQAVDTLFAASPAQLGKAAVKSAGKRRR
jgi:prevent-host-death family protein